MLLNWGADEGGNWRSARQETEPADHTLGRRQTERTVVLEIIEGFVHLDRVSVCQDITGSIVSILKFVQQIVLLMECVALVNAFALLGLHVLIVMCG